MTKYIAPDGEGFGERLAQLRGDERVDDREQLLLGLGAQALDLLQSSPWAQGELALAGAGGGHRAPQNRPGSRS